MKALEATRITSRTSFSYDSHYSWASEGSEGSAAGSDANHLRNPDSHLTLSPSWFGSVSLLSLVGHWTGSKSKAHPRCTDNIR
jgi:hypothetical protein